MTAVKTKAEQAEENFLAGCNCCQAVLLAFGPECGLDRDTALRLGSSFGGGFGRLRELCGAVSAAGMVLGMLWGYTELADKSYKQQHYQRVQEFCRRFQETRGHLRCGDLLEGHPGAAGLTPADRTPAYYADRPCAGICYDAAGILEGMLGETE